VRNRKLQTKRRSATIERTSESVDRAPAQARPENGTISELFQLNHIAQIHIACIVEGRE
jgi:hypothetical protein